MSQTDASAEAEVDRSERVDPAEAFQRIANETRLEILEALAAAEDRPISFSDLRHAVGMRDSAQFNYHLQRLVGHYVEHTEAGYDFKHAGEKVIRAVLAGSFTDQPSIEPFPVDGACISCGGHLLACYHDEQMSIDCSECGHRHGRYPFPPGGLADRTTAEIANAFANRVKHLHCLAADGVCPECGGRMTTDIIEDKDCCLGVELHVDHTCDRCGHSLCSAPGLRLLDHSAVVAYHRERGVRLDERPYWTIGWCVSDRYATVLERDPYRIAVSMPLGDDELTVELDDALGVVDVEIG